MKTGRTKSQKGIALIAVIVFTLILTLLGFAVLGVANSEIKLAQKDIDKTKAFYLAEAGLEIFNAKLAIGEIRGDQSGYIEGNLGGGSYRVDYDVNDYTGDAQAIATGTEAGGEQKQVEVTATFLAPPYEYSIYAGGGGGGLDWTFILNGTGDRIYYKLVYDPVTHKYVDVVCAGPEAGAYRDVGGKDTVNGNVYIIGDALLRDQSCINPPVPNTYGLTGDLEATGSVDVSTATGASVAGTVTENAELEEPPNLLIMNYKERNTHNVAKIFTDAGVSNGALPHSDTSGLRDVFQKNPYNMAGECATTLGDDYFLTPTSGFIEGDWLTAKTPLDIGQDRVYYIEGDLWIHSKSTYGFKITGSSTIVVTGNIHLCDNSVYADDSSMMGLVALGGYEDGELTSGGNIYFGDPTTGTLYVSSGMMFAAKDFLYNTDPLGTTVEEAESGFTINGNLTALNEVSILRDWYTNASGKPRPARYDPDTDKWYDAGPGGGAGTELTASQISGMRHYQMEINYDDRVRSRTTQPPCLPRGVGQIFSGLSGWKEVR